MLLGKAPDGRYGRYVRLKDGSFGWIPLVTAAISALPAVLDILNPKPAAVAPPPPPPNNTPLIVGASLGGLMVVSGLAYLLLKK